MNAPQRASAKHSFLRFGLIVLVVSVCLGMSVFQVYRAIVKTERYDLVVATQNAAPVSLNEATHDVATDLASLELRQATARGKWLSDKTIFLDNKIRNRWVGYHVLTPFQLENSRAVILVNRGWVVAPRLRSDLPVVSTTEATIELSGLLRGFERRVFELKAEGPAGRVWQHVREAEYRNSSGLSSEFALIPLILLQTNQSNDGLAREWSAPDHPALHHIGYAVMWLIFTIMAAFYGWMVWKRK